VSDFRTVPVMDGTTLRLGGSTKGEAGHDNVIGHPRSVPKGNYRALAQCAGQMVRDEHGNHNFWWVLVDTPQGTGWVSAVRIAEGGNDEPIDRVTQAATVLEAESHEPNHKKVLIVPGGGKLRMGGATRGPDNAVGTVEGGRTYPALVQVTCEDVTIGNARNFWWVMVDTGHGVGWISAVLIDEGGNDQKIKDVPVTSTVFSWPPDLLP
jgi:hypothetical protein